MDDVQVVFYPTLQHVMSRGFKLKDDKEMFAAFQLYVKPGAYSVVRDAEIVEWSTKENGAIVLKALFLTIVNV